MENVVKDTAVWQTEFINNFNTVLNFLENHEKVDSYLEKAKPYLNKETEKYSIDLVTGVRLICNIVEMKLLKLDDEKSKVYTKVKHDIYKENDEVKTLNDTLNIIKECAEKYFNDFNENLINDYNSYYNYFTNLLKY